MVVVVMGIEAVRMMAVGSGGDGCVAGWGALELRSVNGRSGGGVGQWRRITQFGPHCTCSLAGKEVGPGYNTLTGEGQCSGP